MDVYLTEEAWQSFWAQALEIPRRKARGLLLGHRRGGRFFVEKVFPCSFGQFPTARRYQALNAIFEGKIIGFYSSSRSAGAAAGKCPPFSYNKLFIEFVLHPKKGPILKPSVVEYTDHFHLVPAALAARPKSRQ